MAKYTGPVCRLCRREGTKLYLKGDRCYNVNKDGVVSKMLCPFDKVATTPDGKRKPILPPGPPKNGRRKVSGYNLQLREKQKARRIYGILEKQFLRYFEMAEKKKGNTGENMFIFIERRLDNVVFRLGLGTSRAQARQMVNHGHITVNGKKVNIPSYLVSENDVVAVKESSAEAPIFKAIKELGTKENPPRWLEFDRNTLAGKVVSLPTAEDLDSSIKVHMIVELYSK